jgi:hypothetical protein
VSSCIDTSRPGSAREPDIAEALIQLYRFQVAHNAQLRALADPETIRGVVDIPCVPVALFKTLRWSSLPVGTPTRVFSTSGTTGQRRGEHHLYDTDVYHLAVDVQARFRLGGLPSRTVSLCPRGGGDSSLGDMVDHLSAEVSHAWDGDAVSRSAWPALAAGPTWLAATAFALDLLFAGAGAADLDEGSLVMVTGGFKGRVVRLDAPGLYRAVPGRLGRPRVVAEYGMTELSSQLWSEVVPAGEVPGAFVAPPWLYAYAADPGSGAPLPDGQPGLLRFLDLANVDGVLGIETLDLGVVRPHPLGDRVELLGRLEGSEARGCSLRAEDALLAATATRTSQTRPSR